MSLWNKNGLGCESSSINPATSQQREIEPMNASTAPWCWTGVLQHTNGDKRKLDELSDGKQRAGKSDKSLKEWTGRHRRRGRRGR